MGHVVAGRALRRAHLSQEPGVHHGGGGHARVGDRRQRGHLQRGQRGALSRPVGARRARARLGLAVGPGRTGSRRAGHVLHVRLLRLSRPGADALRTDGLCQREGGSDARRRHAAQDPRHARRVQLLRRVAAASGARPRVRRARLRAGRGPRGRPQSRPVADGAGGGPRDRRAHDSAESAAGHRRRRGRRRHIQRLLLPRWRLLRADQRGPAAGAGRPAL